MGLISGIRARRLLVNQPWPPILGDGRSWATLVTRICEGDFQSLQQAIEGLGLQPLLTYSITDVPGSKDEWIAPELFWNAAETLIALLMEEEPKLEPIVEAYSDETQGIAGRDDLIRDLREIVDACRLAEQLGAQEVTLSITV